MKHVFRQAVAATGIWMCLFVDGQAQTLSLPCYVGRPGTEVVVPLEIDDAAGVAGMRIQVNFDPGMLELTGVQEGSLGNVFDLVWNEDDGVLLLYFAREDSLLSGNGCLAGLVFRIHMGAETNLFSDLTIADACLNDETGVLAIKRINPVATMRGRLTVSDSTVIDNAGNGLPDEWELAMGLDPLSVTADGDEDEDGLTNLQESQLGLDPTKIDTDGDGMDDRSEYMAGTSGSDENDMLAIMPESSGAGRMVFSWQSVTGRVYYVLYSTNLLGLWPSTPLAVVNGDGGEKSFTNNNGVDSKGYFRLQVDWED